LADLSPVGQSRRRQKRTFYIACAALAEDEFRSVAIATNAQSSQCSYNGD